MFRSKSLFFIRIFGLNNKSHFKRWQIRKDFEKQLNQKLKLLHIPQIKHFIFHHFFLTFE